MRFIIDRRKQSSLKNFYWKRGQKVLIALQQPVIELAGNIESEALKLRVSHIMQVGPMNDFVLEMWMKAGSVFAVDMMRQVEKVKKKQEQDIDFWEDHYRRYMRERSLLKAKLIMDTQAQIVNNLIDEILEEGYQNGLGIPEIARQMRGKLVEGLTEINKYQAERIARTEIIGASNTGSYEGAKEAGVELWKEWMHSGNYGPGYREWHVGYQELGQVEMDYEYAPGLLYACDPNADPGEIINCRCDTLYIDK